MLSANSRECPGARCCLSLEQAPDDPAYTLLYTTGSLLCLLQLCSSLPKAYYRAEVLLPQNLHLTLPCMTGGGLEA